MTRAYDVIVCGAGPAGICAAVAAGRRGAEVALFEEDALPGGAWVDYGVQSFTGEPKEGIFSEIQQQLNQIDWCHQETGHCFLWYNLVQVAKGLLQNAGVHFFPYSRITEAVSREDRIIGVATSFSDLGNVERRVTKGQVVIDATGNGDVAASAGCQFRFGREARSEFGEGFAPEEEDESLQQVTWMYICEKQRDTDWKPSGCCMGAGKYLVWGGGFDCRDPLDSGELQKAQSLAWESLQKQFRDLGERGFRVVYVAPKVGVRESRRIVGDYVLNENDLRAGRSFPDAICRAKYPIDPWEPGGKNPFWTDPERCKVPFYQIPYRCLLPKGKDGLLVAGRCISGTHIAMSSYRVTPIASLIGQAAGTAAALSAQRGKALRNLHVKRLQQMLQKDGVSLQEQ